LGYQIKFSRRSTGRVQDEVLKELEKANDQRFENRRKSLELTKRELDQEERENESTRRSRKLMDSFLDHEYP